MAELGFNLGLLVSESLSATSVNYNLPKKVKMSVSQSCPTLCDPMDCSLQVSSVHGVLQARIPEWVAISFSRGSSWPRDQTWIGHIACRFFTVWATREALQRRRRLKITGNFIFSLQSFKSYSVIMKSNGCLCFLDFFFYSQLTNSVVIISGEQWRDLAIHVHVSILP